MEPICGMAIDWSSIEQQLLNQWDECFSHLLKLYFWRGTQWQLKWERDVYSKYPKSRRLRGNNRLPEYNDLLDVLWEASGDIIPSLVGSFVRNMNEDHPGNPYRDMPTISYVPMNEIEGYLYEYFDWLSVQMSTKESIDISEAREELHHLLKKYPYYT